MKRLITAATLVAMLVGSTAMAGTPPHWTNNQERAQERESRDHGASRRNDGRGDRRYGSDPRPEWQGDNRRYDERTWRDDHRDFARERFRGGSYHAPRGYYAYRWHRGDRLPRTYYARPYIVDGYRGYRLYDPPRGCHWVRVRDDVLLTAIATGVVLDVVYNLYY